MIQKAQNFKFRLEFDSSLIYYDKLGIVLDSTGDKKELILNKINIYEIYIQQRDFTRAHSGLRDVAIEIENEFPGDIDLEADYFQVIGSYLLDTGEPDSAKYYLKRSIQVRFDKYGSNDTLLHYAYNKLGNVYLVLSDFDSAYLFHQTALELSRNKQNPINYLTASSYQNLGIAAHMRGDFQLAEDCYTRSLSLKEQLFNYNNPALAKIYGNLGKFYTDLSKYDIALEYYDKAEKLLISKFDRNVIQFAHVYWNKGNIYTLKGDYVKATSYLSKAHSIFETNYGSENHVILKILSDLGLAYDKKGDTLLAISYYHKAAQNKNKAGIVKIYRNLGNIYQTLNQSDSAEKYYHLSIDFAKQIFSGDSYDLALCYQYYGEFLAKYKYDKISLWYYANAADIFIQLFGKKNKDLSKVFQLQGEYFIANTEYDSALIKIQLALVALLPDFSEQDPYTNPSINECILDKYLQDALELKALVLYLRFLESNNLKDLYVSQDIIDLTIAVTEKIRKTYTEEESQLILNKLSRSIFDLGVIVTLELYSKTRDIKHLYHAFNYSEKGHAIILLSALRGLEAKSNTDIPASTQEFENNISNDLATYNNLLYQERQKKKPDGGKMQLWSDEIFKLRLVQDSILASYKQFYPDYFRLKYDYSTISADSALFRLPGDQAILEYYLTDSLVIGFILADGLLSGKILGNKIDMAWKLDSLRKNFTGNDYFNTGEREFEALTSISTELYSILIRPFEELIEGKRLIIIPDGELGYLSFDLLLKQKPSDFTKGYNQLPWLINSNPICYSSSATIHFEQTSRATRKISGNLLAFAPSYVFTDKKRNAGNVDSLMLNLNPITGTKDEINAISELFRTKKLFDDKATETYFKGHAGEYEILHLAMHTIIDNHNPLYSKLVFTPPETGSIDDGYLNTYELFGLHLPGRLAVLSACNTGSGKLERGEGIISLARGFFYAGIPSVVMTLWEIEDHSSADLMALFYENLKKGYPHDIALQRAKIAYLEKAGKLQSHPYFWAGYVIIGKTDPISFKPARYPLFFIFTGGSLLLLVIVIYFFINRRVYFHKKRY